MRATLLHGLGEAAATDVVRKAGERLQDDVAVDAVLRVVKDFARDKPAFAGVIRRVDDIAYVVDQFVAVRMVLVKLEGLHHVLDAIVGAFVSLRGDAAFETVHERVRGEAALELFATYHFVDAEEVEHSRQVDFHAVVHQVLFHEAVGARVVVHQDFAKHGDARLADALLAVFGDFHRVERFDAGAEHVEYLLRRTEFRLLELGGHAHQKRHPVVIDLLRIALVHFVRQQRAVHDFDGVHEDDAPQHVEAEVEAQGEARVDSLVVGTRRNDGYVLEAGFVERLAGEHRVLHGTAVFAVLREAHGDFGLLDFGVVDEPLEAFADVHLAGEADVVVHELLAELDGFLIGHGQVFGHVALRLDVFACEHGESGGEVRREDLPARLVFFHERRVV